MSNRDELIQVTTQLMAGILANSTVKGDSESLDNHVSVSFEIAQAIISKASEYMVEQNHNKN